MISAGNLGRRGARSAHGHGRLSEAVARADRDAQRERRSERRACRGGLASQEVRGR